MTKLYTVEEVAEMFRLNQGTIRKHLRNGLIKGVKVGRVWYVSEETIKSMFNKR